MWKLMSDFAITEDDRKVMSDFIIREPVLTQSEKVKEFEQTWSEWQGCKYSVYVNSGSSANLILVYALSELMGSGSWLCQATTWATNVSPIMQFKMPLQLCDIDQNNFGPKLDELRTRLNQGEYKYLFLTHLLGFNALSDELLDICKEYNLILLEDCCESHGATFKNNKVGNFGIASTFSFYYGHHMTSVEGGMVCTDDENLYHALLLCRSHGLLRSLPSDIQKDREIKGVDPKFTFLLPGFNVRNSEVYAVLGINQLKRLNKNIEIRNSNLIKFLSEIDPEKYKIDFNIEGVSSYSLPIISLKNNIDSVKNELDKMNIEWRPIIAGNLFRHPFMDRVNQFKTGVSSDFIHDNGIYVGNHQDVTLDMVKELADRINSL